MTSSRPYSQRAVATGLVLGAGVGSTTALLVDVDLATGAGWGVAGGIVVGALLGRVLDRRAAAGDRPLSWLFGPAVGLAVGAAIGIVGAWSVEAPFADGFLVGAAAGLALGVLLGGTLAVGRRSERGGGEAPEQSA